MHVPWEGNELGPLKAHDSRDYGYFEKWALHSKLGYRFSLNYL